MELKSAASFSRPPRKPQPTRSRPLRSQSLVPAGLALVYWDSRKGRTLEVRHVCLNPGHCALGILFKDAAAQASRLKIKSGDEVMVEMVSVRERPA
jgi:hypothetical protein